MPINLKGKSILSVKDLSNQEVQYLLKLSQTLKRLKESQVVQEPIKPSKSIAVIMQKSSTRTRSAFEVAAYDLGLNVTFISGNDSQMGVKESMEDTAKVLGRFYDGIAFRGFEHKDVEDLANFSGIPVWNALTDDFHPTQVFADYLTILEHFGRTNIKFAFFGDAKNNMGNSLALMAAHMGAYFVGCAPKEYWPEESVMKEIAKISNYTGAKVEFTEDTTEAAAGADVIYTDVWVSMGEPFEAWKKRINDLKPYQVNSKIMNLSSEDSIFLHCLPSFHDTNTTKGMEIYEKFGLKELEVTDEVFRSKKSKVFDQAENRMHTIKAIILSTI